jgi:hypothetical protein
MYDFDPRYQHLFQTDGVSSTNPCCLCRPKTSCPDPRTCDELLESVAVAQRALAQILNAEGEKLKRIIVSTNDINTLLEANRAINRTLAEVTFMEQALCHKLELIQEICHVYEGCLPETEAPK